MTVPADDPQPWEAWAPPLDPPTAGGMPYALAQQIADTWWAVSPHLCAALQWEWYAATLIPTPAVSNVNTGAQSVSYSPAVASGDWGTAQARIDYHRSFLGDSASVQLVRQDRAAQYPTSWTYW